MNSNFQVLYVQHNKLKKIPESVGNLRKLQNLNLSHNNVKELPASLAKLPRLRSLDLRSNPKLTKLVKTLAEVRSLEKLLLDAKVFQYPSADVCEGGTEKIMKFLCKGKKKFFL